MTKNDLCAFLIKEGLRRGFEVMPEFSIDLPPRTVTNRSGKRVPKRVKKIVDLVWAVRNDDHPGPQDKSNANYWTLKAIFEIEGCNIPRGTTAKKGFRRHIASFPQIANLNGGPLQKYVVLYTNAHDRYWPSGMPFQQKVDERKKWGGDTVPVFDGTTIPAELDRLFPVDENACGACKRVATNADAARNWQREELNR